MPVSSPVPFVPGTSPGQAPDESSPPEHLDYASLLSVRGADAFRGAPYMALMLEFLAESMQLTETVHQSVRELCWLSTADGMQLDRMLNDLGDSRNGRSDDEVRRLIPAMWCALFRERSLKSLHDILSLLCDDLGLSYTYENTGTASYMVTVFGVTLEYAEEIYTLLRLSKPEGVGFRLLVVLDQPFRFDIGPGWDSGVLAHYAGGV